jgi:hypothetical protein
MQYTGDMITIAVRGASFRVTPNHPILTIDGWKPAYLLNIGDHLIQTWNDALSRLESDENNLHPSFQELFEANSPLIEVLSPLGFDFHGDRPKGDVEQISFADDLGMRVEMPRSESEKQFPFSIPYSGIRCTGQSIGTHVSSSLRSPSGEPFSASFNGGSSHSPDHDLAFSTQTDTMLAKSFDDGKTVNPKGFGDTDRCFSGLIPSGDLVNGEQDKIVGSKPFMRDWDALLPEPLAEYVRGNADLLRNSAESHLPYKLRRIVDKAVSSFSGHVYTLQSDNGWYCVTSASIISQNCRCDANVIVDLDQVDWPHKVYSRGSITRMGRARFLKLIHA